MKRVQLHLDDKELKQALKKARKEVDPEISGSKLIRTLIRQFLSK